MAVSLRRWKLEDALLVQEASLDAYVAGMIRVTPGCGRTAAQNWIRRAMESHSRVIVEGGEALGEVGITPDAFGYSGVLHYWVLARARGRGLAQRAAALACQGAGKLLLTAIVSERNAASVKVLEKLGFQRGAHQGIRRLPGPARYL